MKPSDVLDVATSEIAIGTKFGIEATKKLPSEELKWPWPPLIKMDEVVKQKINQDRSIWLATWDAGGAQDREGIVGSSLPPATVTP